MVKIGKKNGKTYAIFEGNYDIFKLENGLYVVISNEKIKETITKKIHYKKEVSNTSKKRELNKRELGILTKISLVKYSEREWEKIMSMLGKGDQIILKSLIKRGYVKTFIKGGKQYIAFSDEMYERLRKAEKSEKKDEKREGNIINIDNNFFIVPKSKSNIIAKEIDLKNYSYVVDSNGVVYLAEKRKAKTYYKRIITALKKGKAHYEEISERAKIRREVALVLLKILCEEGEVYEPEKGVFEMVK